MKTAYLTLACIGAAAPYVFFSQFMPEEGVHLGRFVEQLFATMPAAGFTLDLLITSGVFWLWSFRESRQHGICHGWAFVLLNLLVGLSCAFPLFLFFRLRAMEHVE